MAEFDPAVEIVLRHEGELSVNAQDPGGTTNFGISQRSYPDLDITALTREQAKEIYRRDFWRFDCIQSQRVANKLFDLAVNIGSIHATKILQQTLSYFVVGPLVIDGVLGPQTISSIESVHEEPLIAELKARAIVYHAEVATRPGLKQFLLGWIRRDLDG